MNTEPQTVVSFKPYLDHSLAINSRNPLIVQTAAAITRDSQNDFQRVRALLGWIQDNIEKKAVDAFTAMDVLQKRQAECQGHALLMIAFLRALNIPSRAVHGIVYSKHLEGFMYHSWVEARMAGNWFALDPVFSQFPADATHIKIVEGEEMAALVPLVSLIGKLQVEIVSYE